MPLGILKTSESGHLMTQVAHMYHELGMTQSEIAGKLFMSQARISRTLKRAVETGVVRTSVVPPVGVYLEIEEQLQSRYQLEHSMVVDSGGSKKEVAAAIGSVAAEYLSATLFGDEVVGLSSWSETILRTVEAMSPSRVAVAKNVVQLVGGLGDPRVQMQASRLMEQFAALTGAAPILLPAPAIVSNAALRVSLSNDPVVAEVAKVWEQLTTVLLGIGELTPSPLAQESGNAFPENEREVLESLGAVGDICFRFFDEAGRPIASDLDDRVIGISVDQIMATPRRIGVAGGEGKIEAIAGALEEAWINVLITDIGTAEALLAR